jgi:hypothetical protein
MIQDNSNMYHKSLEQYLNFRRMSRRNVELNKISGSIPLKSNQRYKDHKYNKLSVS